MDLEFPDSVGLQFPQLEDGVTSLRGTDQLRGQHGASVTCKIVNISGSVGQAMSVANTRAAVAWKLLQTRCK